MTKKIRVLVFKHGEWWVSQVLEHDIVAQAKTLPDLLERTGRTILGYIAIALEGGRDPLGDIPPAPEEFFERYERMSIPLAPGRPLFRVEGLTIEQGCEPELRVC